MPLPDITDLCYVCKRPVVPYVAYRERGIGDRLLPDLYFRRPTEEEDILDRSADGGSWSVCEICSGYFHDHCDSGWHTDECGHMCSACYDREVELGNAEEEE
jgi:hypothetical protein